MKTSFRALMVVLVFAVLGMPGVTRSSVSVTAPKISNEEFGRLVESFSELDKGEYGWKNFLSNEQSFASLFPGLTKVAAQGGAYIGVGPEQNFTYIGKLRPEVAFIVDIQRRNMLQILFYKALFEHAETPTQFLELLIARSGNSVEELLKLRGFGDPTMLRKSLGIVYASIKSHGITLSAQDRAVIEEIAGEFALYGGSIHSDTPPMQPTLEDLVLEKDHVGQRHCCLCDDRSVYCV